MCFVLGPLRLLRWCAHEEREETEEGHFESSPPPLVGTLRWGKAVSCAQGPSNDDGEAVALLRDRVCFVLGQLRLLRWCAHEEREESEEGHFGSRPPTGWYLKVRQVSFLCAGAK